MYLYIKRALKIAHLRIKIVQNGILTIVTHVI